MISKQLLYLSLLLAPASAFVAPKLSHHGRLVSQMRAAEDEDPMAKVKNAIPDMDNILGKVPEMNFDSLDIDAIKSNLMDGSVGERGEAYVAAQFALLACIVGGGIPVIGDALMLLLGPCLMLAGAAAVLLSTKDLGSNLSPWPVPPVKGDLVQEGIYSKLRHPQYAGLLGLLAGFSIVTGSASRLLLTGALFYVFNIMADYEEEELVKKYPDYDFYVNKVTGKFFPDEVMKQLPWNQDA